MAQGAPLPVSALLRRARNAKSPKDRHDTAYYAWEASVILAVAARPPADLAPLAKPSVGAWVAALASGEERHAEPPLLAVLGLLSEAGTGRKAAPKSVARRELLAALPAYRNAVLGHGSVRTGEFYDGAGAALVEGLEVAWEQGLFLKRDERLTYVEAVEIDPSGRRRARLLDLTGEMGHVIDPRGTPDVPDTLLPRRAYVRAGSEYRALHPFVLVREGEALERVYLFGSLTHRAKYLDYVSGETLSGADLESVFPGVEAEAFARFERRRDEAPAARAEEADRFGDYKILGKLGEGGMGVVYLARQESLGRLVALKMLPPGMADDPVAVARFDREVAALSRCEHPNVIKILASGAARGTRYYAMEYVEGADLGRVLPALKESRDLTTAVSSAWERLKDERKELFQGLPEAPRHEVPTAKGGRGEIEQLAVAFRDAARGLEHLHEAGIVHRDVKPQNLMLTASDRRVVVMDLGLAAVTGASRSITRDKGQILGTLRYMAPEQLQRNLLAVDQRADVYSLGATFYELLTGRALRDGDTEARLIEQILRETPPSAKKVEPRIPTDLSTILGKATEKDPKLRYETAEEVAEDLDAFLEGRPISARPPTLRYVLGLAIRRNKALAATVAVGLVLLAGVVAYFLRSLTQERNNVRVERDNAQVERDKARSERERALADSARVEDLSSLRAVLASWETLFPVNPDSLSRAARLIVRARETVTRLPEHERSLAALEAQALARPGAGGASDEKAWRFAEPTDATAHRVLGEIVREGQPMAAEGATSALSALEERFKPATTQPVDWGPVIEEIADRTKSPVYGGLRIEPSFGLFPLGKDPQSGLYEFAHLYSGSLPTRGNDGVLTYAEDAAAVFVLIPGGRFWMGASRAGERNVDPSARDAESPVHEVTLSAFFLGKHECTQAQWARLTGGQTPSYQKPTPGGASPGAITQRNPVEQVSWDDCAGSPGWVGRYGLSLPTEAQWEYACRTGTTTAYAFGATLTKEQANIENAVGKTTPVGTYRANAWGLFDIYGNVSEWCADTWHADYTGAPTDGRAWIDAAASFRVLRGGSWRDTAGFARSADRGGSAPGTRLGYLGFRLARPSPL